MKYPINAYPRNMSNRRFPVFSVSKAIIFGVNVDREKCYYLKFDCQSG